MATEVAVGPGLDALVAEWVMGWTRARYALRPQGSDTMGWTKPGGDHGSRRVPDQFSTTWEGGGRVIERTRELPDDVQVAFARALIVQTMPETHSHWLGNDVMDAALLVSVLLHELTSESICRAALVALGADNASH